ncbi:hemicentin-1 isoform X2, partial [Paramuricea clavata]
MSGCVSGGNHTCQLTSNVGNNSNIAVLELHQHLVINCSTTQKSSSNLTFEWKKDNRVKKIGVPSINISDVAWNDAGRYECIIKQNRSLESCDFTVIVKTLPHVTIQRPNVLTNTMIVPCLVTGYFKPNKVIWYKNNKQIFPNDTGYFVENLNKNDFLFVSDLQRSHANLNDSGNYSCEARNIYGTSPRTYHYISKFFIN